jgi:hypothetical protein
MSGTLAADGNLPLQVLIGYSIVVAAPIVAGWRRVAAQPLAVHQASFSGAVRLGGAWTCRRPRAPRALFARRGSLVSLLTPRRPVPLLRSKAGLGLRFGARRFETRLRAEPARQAFPGGFEPVPTRLGGTTGTGTRASSRQDATGRVFRPGSMG